MANIDQDQAGHSIKVDVAGSFEAEGVLGAVEEEFAQAALLTAGEDHFGIGIQTPGGNHRPEAIKIGIDVGRDNVHVGKPAVWGLGAGGWGLETPCSKIYYTSPQSPISSL